MKILLLSLLLVSLSAGGLPQDAARGQSGSTLDQFCGRLVLHQLIPHKGSTNSFNDKTRSLRRVGLLLYKHGNGDACCENLSLVAKIFTGWGGRFKIKDIAPGDYWLVAHLKNRVYQLQIRYVPSKDHIFECSDQLFEIEDSGEFRLSKSVTVTVE